MPPASSEPLRKSEFVFWAALGTTACTTIQATRKAAGRAHFISRMCSRTESRSVRNATRAARPRKLN